MPAITVRPGRRGSARLDQIPEPLPDDGAVLVETIAVGVCGTDREILTGLYGTAPPGRERLVLGHESLARVLGDSPSINVEQRIRLKRPAAVLAVVALAGGLLWFAFPTLYFRFS